MRVSHFTLEVELEFESTTELEKFIKWVESLRNFHPPQKES